MSSGVRRTTELQVGSANQPHHYLRFTCYRHSTSCGVGQFERLANVLCFLTVLRRRQTVCVWCPFQPLLEAVRERRWWVDWQPSWRQPRHRGAYHTYSRALAGRVGISIATRQHTLKLCATYVPRHTVHCPSVWYGMSLRAACSLLSLCY